MLTVQLLERMQRLTALLGDDTFLMTALVQLEGHNDRIASAVHAELEASTTIEDKQHQVRAEIEAGIATAKKLSPRRLMPEIDAIERAAEDMPGIDGRRLDAVVNAIRNFSALYDAFFSSQSAPDAFDLFTAAASLKAALLTTRSFASAVDVALRAEPQLPMPADMDRLRLLLAARGDLRVVGIKVLALADVYYELAVLLNVSTTEYPPLVSRVEAGSLWIEIVGNAAVIAAATAIISRAAIWIHQRFTKDGRVTVIPRNVEAIERLLHVSDELAARGIDVGAINEQLAKSTFLIGENLNALLSDEARVELNDQTFSITQAFEQRRLLTSDTRALPEPEAAPDEDDNDEKGGA